ncbi:hypothetical protein DHEL01_v204519 [Diaporthe helianthi]|uniref:AB hydrolase-1 domain-containing protein n=1 Tax=Diaporthe helianthi TaxID=158607 RepID=A0A2P5I3J3_DIAHE|nr:hypothetical protein DHEL01_v204519 [Diaporthe helianthi]
MSKPTILLVPGACAPGHVYNNVLEKVRTSGYDIRALQKPSLLLETGSPTARNPPSMYEDAAYIASQAEALADEGKDVVIIAHSYGGVPSTECIKGLAKDARQKLGKPGGIVRLAYMTALVPALGSSAADVLDLGERSADDCMSMNVDDAGWMSVPITANNLRVLVPGLPREEAEKWGGLMTAQSAVSFGDPLTYAGYKDVPVSYLICEEDLVILAGNQKRMVDLIEQGGRKVDVTSIPAGHTPNITATQAVVEWITHVANKDVDQDV